MIKFFRKIRQNLIMENKKGKYFKYAIGEIVLVVIGILIALQINNWNEQRKTKDLYYSYLTRLKEDFTFILNSTAEAKLIEEHLIELGKLVLNVSLNKENNVDPLELAIGIDFTAGRHYYTKKSQTWTDLISTGNLKLIENKGLRNEIGAYNNLIDQRHFQIEEWFNWKVQYRDLTRNILYPDERLIIVQNNWPYLGMERLGIKDVKLLTTYNEMRTNLQSKPELIGILTDVIMSRNITVNMMQEELENLNGILEILEFEISKFD